MSEQLMTVDHFGSGGRRSDSRLGRRGKKLAESRKVGKWESREVVISEISRFLKKSEVRKMNEKKEKVMLQGRWKVNRRISL